MNQHFLYLLTLDRKDKDQNKEKEKQTQEKQNFDKNSVVIIEKMSVLQQQKQDNQLIDQMSINRKQQVNEENKIIQVDLDQHIQGGQKTSSIPSSQKKMLQVKNSLLIFQEPLNKGITTKVHSVDQEGNQHEQLLPFSAVTSTSSSKNPTIFSVKLFKKEYSQCQKKIGEANDGGGRYQEILVEDCIVNFYALKELIKHTSLDLTRLIIRKCLFYENDKLVLKPKRNDAKNLKRSKQKKQKIEVSEDYEKQINDNDEEINLNNNRMLKEINITFLVASIKLPCIESIEIELLTSTSSQIKSQQQQMQQQQLQQQQQQSQEAHQQPAIILPELNQNQQKNLKGRSSTKQLIQNEEKTAEQLVTEYECYKESPFVDFQLNIKPLLDDNFRNKSQSQVFNQIVGGSQSLQNLNQIYICINENIINEIKEQVDLFVKYIKGSFLNNSIIVIKERCFESHIAFGIMKNLVIQNIKNLKTVIFKEIGITPPDCFLWMIDALLEAKNLQSVAFLASQPDAISYNLLKDLFQMKQFVCIVLNRTCFNIADIQFGKNQQVIKSGKVEVIPKYYGFFMLDRNGLYEFTPYKSLIKEILFSKYNQDINDPLLQEELNQYEIGKMIKGQSKYPYKYQQIISTFENPHVLTYSGVVERILEKYFIDHETQKVDLYKDQDVLKSDIEQLLASQNYFYKNFITEMINQIVDPMIRSKLNDKLKSFVDNPFVLSLNNSQPNQNFLHMDQQNSIDLMVDLEYKFFIESGFTKQKPPGYFKNGYFFTNHYSERTIQKKQYCSHLNFQLVSIKLESEFNPNSIFEMLKINKSLNYLVITQENKYFSLEEVIIDGQKKIHKELLKLERQNEFFSSNEFMHFYTQLLQKWKEIIDQKIKVCYIIRGNEEVQEQLHNSFFRLMELFEQEKIRLRKVKLNGFTYVDDPKVSSRVFSVTINRLKLENSHLSQWIFKSQQIIEKITLSQSILGFSNQTFELNFVKQIVLKDNTYSFMENFIKSLIKFCEQNQQGISLETLTIMSTSSNSNSIFSKDFYSQYSYLYLSQQYFFKVNFLMGDHIFIIKTVIQFEENVLNFTLNKVSKS